MKKIFKCFLLGGLLLTMLNCTDKEKSITTNQEKKAASNYTKNYNQEYASRLNWNDTLDFKNSERGFLAGPIDSIIMSETIKDLIVWDFHKLNFPQNPNAEAPSTINPSLWRMSQLNTKAGLFEVMEGKIYQIRNFDLAVMSFIIGPDGYVIVDPLMSPETAKAGHHLFLNELKDVIGNKKLKGIIITHSHIDHFGGVNGILKDTLVDANDVTTYAPSGFMDAAVSENVFAGNVMGARAAYMYGDLIPKDTLSGIGSGLGKATSDGTAAIVAPDENIGTFKEMTTKEIAGLQFEFLYAPNTEAPAEMLFYVKNYEAICAAEDATQTMHNLYTLRGAKTRDAKEWVNTLTTVLDKWGNSAEVEFNSHHWPVWENKFIKNHLETQRAMYKYLHDQTLHYANMGYDMTTTAEILNNLPQSLNTVWSSQGYYGTVNHNVKATWSFYLGWFDANPSNLHKLPSSQSSPKYVALMGGPENILEQAGKAYKKGEYRWVAEVVQHIINASDTIGPKNKVNYKKAKNLVADAYEQMGYQAVSGPWRNFYLTGAQELRHGKTTPPESNLKDGIKALPITLVTAMTLDMKFDMIAIMVDAEKASQVTEEINFGLIIEEPLKKPETTAFQLKYACLNYLVDKEKINNLDFTITVNKKLFNQLMAGRNPMKAIKKLITEGREKRIQINYNEPKEKNEAKFDSLVGVFSNVMIPFNIVTPNSPQKPINPMTPDNQQK